MNNSPEQKILRATRLKKLRKMTHYSRKAFSEKYNVSQGTLQNWETARFGGLTEKGANIMIQALSNEGLFCSFEWLMYGLGSSPIISETSIKRHNYNESVSAVPQDQVIEKELDLYVSLTPDATTIKVIDDSMEPYFCSGQILAGRKRTGKKIDNLINKTCIVETSGKKLLRYIKKGTISNCYNLICLNRDSKVDEPFIYNAVLQSAAPITWVRSPDN
ncbi:MAG: hypothetical protein VX335_01840 [Pseudomonadota bacterium]|nr:hypothetical protein [Pseudomonadota bacterium]